MAKRLQPPIDVTIDDTILRTFIMFVQTAHTVLKYADAHFYRKAGLSAIKFIVLNGLAFHGGSMRPSEIAEWTYRERHNVTTLVDRLKRDGFVKTNRRWKCTINSQVCDTPTPSWQMFLIIDKPPLYPLNSK